MAEKNNNNIRVPDGLMTLLETSMNKAEAHKKRRKRVAYSAAILVLAACLVLPNTTPAVSQALSGLPVIGNAFGVVTVRDFSEDTPGYFADVKVPYIAAADAGSQAEADKINEEIDKSLDEAVADFEQLREEAEGKGFGELLSDWEIVSDSSDYFTLKVSAYTSNADGFMKEDYYNIDKKTGKRVLLSDVYGAGCEKKITEDIVRQMKEQMEEDESLSYFIGGDGFTQIAEDQDFYMDENGDPVICFDEMEVAPAYMGTPEFTVHIE